MKYFKHILLQGILTLTLFSPLAATNYYCDPVNGNIGNDGSQAHPWNTLQAVFENHKTLAAGDTLFLMSGYHGTPLIYGRNGDYVVITRYRDDTARLGSLRFSSASYWMVDGVDISSELPDGKDVYDFYFLVQTSTNSDHIIFQNCNVYSNHGTEHWNRDDWFTRRASGFMLASTETQLIGNHIKNINFGVEIRGQHTVMTGNTIENFVGDAIRGLASYCTYEYNVVKNCYDITGYNPSEEGPGNHDDGFQSYTSAVGGVEETVKEVILRNNIFISYTDPGQIEKSMMQGIACFDGYYYNWIVENNLVVTDSWHGISFLGVEDTKIANNTVLNNPIDNPLVLNGTPVNDMTPWIWIGPLKEDRGGGPSGDNIIRNNLIIQSKAGFNGNQSIYDQGENTLIQNNREIPTGQEGSYFFNPQNLDYHLKTGSPAIDYGINIDLPANDPDKNPRLIGPAADAGAYEFQTNLAGVSAPVLDPVQNDSIQEGDTLIITVTASDADQDPLTFTLSPTLPFITFTDNSDGTATLTAKPAAGNYGNYTFTVVVSDGTYDNTRHFTLFIAQNPDLSTQDMTGNGIIIYPNPIRNGTLFIRPADASFQSGKMVVTDISGRIIYTCNLSGKAVRDNTIRIEAPWLRKNGIYILKIISGSKQSTTKIVVTGIQAINTKCLIF